MTERDEEIAYGVISIDLHETPAAAARRKVRSALAASFPGQDIPEELVEGLGRLQEDLDWRDHLAWAEARSGPRFRPGRRTCLGPLCRGRRTFDSDHAGIRVCEACRALLARRYGEFDEVV